MDVEDDAVALKIKHSDPEKERQCCRIQIPQIRMKLRLVDVLPLAVEHDGGEGEDYRQIGKERDVGDEGEGFEPAYGDEDQHAKHNISWHIVAEVLSRLYAYHLVHLVADEEEVGDTEPDLRDGDAEVHESFAASAVDGVAHFGVGGDDGAGLG